MDIKVKKNHEASEHTGALTTRRAIAVAKVLVQVWIKRAKVDVLYLTISESFGGNLKDLCIYLLCAPHLSRMYVHLHGGSIKRLLFDRHPMVRRLNALFLRRLAGAIISGRSHLNIFEGMIDPAKLHIVANFAQDPLFATEEEIAVRFADTRPLRILYISSMTIPKGFRDLAEGYLSLPSGLRDRVQIDFAGRFESEDLERSFLSMIRGVERLVYHGVVDDATKQRLFARAHLFCLPTSMLEGQPLSILEAYASGCVVATTGQPGIRDVFRPGVNGYEIQMGSSVSIRCLLEELILDPDPLAEIAVRNSKTARAYYRTSTYNAALRAVLESTPVLRRPAVTGQTFTSTS